MGIIKAYKFVNIYVSWVVIQPKGVVTLQKHDGGGEEMPACIEASKRRKCRKGKQERMLISLLP
jgi:hypothetical protein